jgi:hypothetical protein
MSETVDLLLVLPDLTMEGSKMWVYSPLVDSDKCCKTWKRGKATAYNGKAFMETRNESQILLAYE